MRTTPASSDDCEFIDQQRQVNEQMRWVFDVQADGAQQASRTPVTTSHSESTSAGLRVCYTGALSSGSRPSSSLAWERCQNWRGLLEMP
jgi:hypothetical protein